MRKISRTESAKQLEVIAGCCRMRGRSERRICLYKGERHYFAIFQVKAKISSSQSSLAVRSQSFANFAWLDSLERRLSWQSSTFTPLEQFSTVFSLPNALQMLPRQLHNISLHCSSSFTKEHLLLLRQDQLLIWNLQPFIAWINIFSSQSLKLISSHSLFFFAFHDVPVHSGICFLG